LWDSQCTLWSPDRCCTVCENWDMYAPIGAYIWTKRSQDYVLRGGSLFKEGGRGAAEGFKQGNWCAKDGKPPGAGHLLLTPKNPRRMTTMKCLILKLQCGSRVPKSHKQLFRSISIWFGILDTGNSTSQEKLWPMRNSTDYA
jgi:hypothetical protein